MNATPMKSAMPSRPGACQELRPQSDEERAFIQLVEQVQGGPTRIEVYLPGEPKLVIDGAAVIRVLAHMIKAIDQ